MPLSIDQAKPLAALIHQLRPQWDERGILSALKDCAGRNEFDVVMAAVRAAADMGAKTPGVIPSAGPHWQERLSEQRSPRNPMPHEECVKHPGQFRLSCSGCRSDKLAPVVALRAPQGFDRAAALAETRQKLADAKAATGYVDRRPFVPPTPETPAQRVQGEAGEVALEPCDSCGAGRNEPCCDGCSEDVDCRSFR